MKKWQVRGKLYVDLYVTVEADGEEEAIDKAFSVFDDAVQDDLEMGQGIQMESPEVDMRNAEEVK